MHITNIASEKNSVRVNEMQNQGLNSICFPFYWIGLRKTESILLWFMPHFKINQDIKCPISHIIHQYDHTI